MAVDAVDAFHPFIAGAQVVDEATAFKMVYSDIICPARYPTGVLWFAAFLQNIGDGISNAHDTVGTAHGVNIGTGGR